MRRRGVKAPAARGPTDAAQSDMKHGFGGGLDIGLRLRPIRPYRPSGTGPGIPGKIHAART